MSDVRIFQPAKTAMQSGQANTRSWVLEFEPAQTDHDPLMGWIGSSDTRGQVRLRFATKDEAIAFAEKRGFTYRLDEPKHRQIRPKSYAENFRYQKLT